MFLDKNNQRGNSLMEALAVITVICLLSASVFNRNYRFSGTSRAWYIRKHAASYPRLLQSYRKYDHKPLFQRSRRRNVNSRSCIHSSRYCKRLLSYINSYEVVAQKLSAWHVLCNSRIYSWLNSHNLYLYGKGCRLYYLNSASNSASLDHVRGYACRRICAIICARPLFKKDKQDKPIIWEYRYE